MAKPSPLLNYLAGNNAPDDALNTENASLLLAEARACGLLGRVAQMLKKSPQFNFLPAHIADQLSASTIHSEAFRRDAWRELGHIEQALAGLDTPVLLLKGASYILLDLPTADGRTFSDIDILVAKNHVASAEAALMLGGWTAGKLNAYDQRYYRQWSHEIPPMTHLRRGTTIDLHHSLVMPTCRIQVDSGRMVSEAIPVDGSKLWWRLKDEDMVLHAASHLLLNSEFDRGLRDIWDIDLLYRHFTSLSASFPERLLARAREVGLEAILMEALVLASIFFGTSFPDGLTPARSSLFSRLLLRAASTRHPDTRPQGQAAADFALMLREMYLRLPNNLLVVHLQHKLSQLFSSPERKPV